MTREELIDILKEVIAIEVSKGSEYSGCDSGWMDSVKIQLLIDGQVICTEYLS